MPFKEMLRRQISESNTEEAINMIELFFKRVEDFENELAILKARYHRFAEEEAKGVFSVEDDNRIRNKINDDLMKYYDKIEKEFSEFVTFKTIQISEESLEAQLRHKLKDKYNVEEKPLGQGATSIIFKAEQIYSGKPVAVRALRNQEFGSKDNQMVFNNVNIEVEVKHLLKIKHRNIIKINEFFLDDFPACYVEEFVDGPTLREVLKFGAFPLERATNIIYQLGNASYYLHSKGIIHKRLRPSKVFIDSEGIPMITPFQELSNNFNSVDLRRFRSELAYLSPEELEGVPANDHSDQFTLGLLAYELIKGQPLFSGNTIMDVLKNRNAYFKNKSYRDSLYEELGLPNQLSRTLKRMLAFDPQKRFRCVKDASDIFRKFNVLQENEANKIVEESYKRCRNNNPRFTEDFYINLFSSHPSLIPFFNQINENEQNESQKETLKAFMNALESYKSDRKVEIRKSISEQIIIPSFIRTPSRMLKDTFSLIWTPTVNKQLLKEIVGSAHHQGVAAGQFQLFMENLIVTVQQNDYLWDDKIQNAWEQMVAQIMSYINSKE